MPMPVVPVWIADHPRSRGVYGHRPFAARGFGGSSPLARGLQECFAIDECQARIIPARAGFTIMMWKDDLYVKGSSPLARGLRRADYVRPVG